MNGDDHFRAHLSDHVGRQVSDEAAIQVEFTQVSFARPDDQQFAFNPPPGAKVEESTETAKPDATKPDATKPEDAAAQRPAIIGSGWTSVIVARLPQATAETPASANGGGATDPTALLKNLPTVKGAWGSGHLLSSRLFSVLLTDDGRVLVGAVAPDRLYQAASDPKAKLGS